MSDRPARHVSDAPALLYRAVDVAKVLAISESVVRALERSGQIQRVTVPGRRATRYSARQVEDLAASWIANSRGAE